MKNKKEKKIKNERDSDMTPFPQYELINQIDHDDDIQVGGLHYNLCSIIEK